MNEPIYIDRPPRIQPELPSDEVEIPGPPEKEEDARARLIQVGLPLLTIIGYVLVSTLGGRGRSPLLLIPMALSVVASTGFAIYSYFKENRRRTEIERAYSERLVELNREMHMYHDMQRRFYGYNYPDRRTMFRIVHNARVEVEKAERTLRSEARLWERRVSDEDFGVVRLGMGTLPSTVLYVLREVENFDDPQVREAMKLETDSRYVTDIPVIISLRQASEDQQEEQEQEKEQEEDTRTPITHALGIAGESRSVYEFVRAFLAHYVVFHAPMDARLFVLASSKQEWAWTELLPHSQTDEQSQYLCFAGEIEEDTKEKAFDEDDESVVERFLEGIRKVLAQRKIRLEEREENDSQPDSTLPFLLVVVDLLEATTDPGSPLSDLESDAAISLLLEEGATLGAAVIFLVPERSKIPSGCRGVIEIERTTPETNSRIEQNQKLHFRYAETGVNSFRYVGEADYVANPADSLTLAEKLAALKVRQGYGANLTNSVPFLELMGYTSLQELEADTWQKWQDSTQPHYANWLRVKLGLMSGNKPRTLVFSAKRDGVHGMVAGSTGSGKSELLISLITGMAVTYDPTLLNFVLVDYKGGGAFKELKDLPHCVDIITNLGADGVTRMFTAIQSELQRRQALNAETGTKNIVEYRQKGLHNTYHPYPYLFIIIDEFAEMIADRSEYRAQLESITRVGRAQGVSLILAAQRPSGVTDQMRSNIKFRICLRVETPGESREMLRRPDAAFLPSGVPGRGFLQVGNEELELIQVAYTGEKYVDPNQAPQADVIWPDRGDTYDESRDQEPPELYKAIVAVLNRMAREHGVKEQRAPWPDFLPTQLALSELLVSADPDVKAITSEQYLADIDKITLGREREASLTLNPSVNKWLTVENGWIEDLDWENYAMRPVLGLVDNPYAAKQSPLVIHLPRGHVAIFGASGWGKTTLMRSLVVSLTATHSPDQLHVYVLDLGGRNLGVLGNLPHVGAVIIPDEEGYEERVEQLLREIDTIVEERKNILNNAGVSDIYQYNQDHADDAQPAILVAIDNFVEFIETFGSENDNVESVLDKYVALARQAKPYGIHFVISVNQMGNLSNQLYSLFTERLTLKLADPTEYRAIVGGHVADIGDIPGRGYVKMGSQPLSFQVALPLDLRREGLEGAANEVQELEQFAKNMQDYLARSEHKYKKPVRIDALPKTILFKQILARAHGLDLDETFLDRLKKIAKQNWADSIDPDQADWLKVTVGVVSGNRLRQMELEAKKDGVHGMIAGGTGSGKSELLMTLIVGLALNYDPSVLNFVLVDYKGGGAFLPFENLPHCVDTITNLNKAAVKRMFTAINAEMQRRQKLNAETATKDIVEYRAKGLHLSHAPYPHLFIIIDEYAEMITDNPEFRDELDSITRVGRAQGVNLLLASQRPTGVSDQMRANIKFRICLRVEGVDTSREMLRRSDAAFLPSGMPGRGYLQVGNENIELMQVAYTGETYPYAEVPEGGRPPKFYDVIVDLANELLQGERPRTPWPPFLPAAVTLSDPLVEGYLDASYRPLISLGRTDRLALNPFAQDWLDGRGTWHAMDWSKTAMRAIVGLLDDPYNARQLPLVVDVTKGHAVIFGASGWGKTAFLRSLILSLAATHSPDEFHAHVLDLGGRNLEVLRALPQVGTIIMPDERGYEERVQQLWRELNDMLDDRKRLFSETGVSTLYEYNASHPDQVQPAILVVIDNFAEYIESFGGSVQKTDQDNLLEAFVSLARQGKAYGLHFVISASRLNVLTSKLYSLFTERMTLRLSDSGDYSAIVGSNIGDIEEIPGRGSTKLGRQALSFQIALPPGTVDSQGRVGGEAKQIRAIGARMQEFIEGTEHSYRQPLRIDALPKSSSYRQVLSEMLDISQEKTFLDELKAATQGVWQRNRSAEHADWLQVTLGITSGNRKRTLQLEAKKDGVHGMIAGGTGSGKSEMLMTMIVGLALNYPPDILNLVLVDYKGGGAFKPFERLPHCVDIVTNLNKAAVDRMFTAINAEIRRRQALNAETGTKDIIEYRAKGLHLSREPYPHLFIIIDEYAEMIDDNPEYRMELESITRVGRAQGVNLILASQRPKGVSDQMRANIKLRLCLRVEQIDTSQELLRRPDAALLPSGLPGRGYLQVGNENLELIQVSWTGEKQPDEREAQVLWADRPQVETGPGDEDVPKLYDAVVNITSELVEGQMAPKPWPGFLPTNFSLQSPLYHAQKNQSFTLEGAVGDWLNGEAHELWPGVDWRQGAMRPVVGLVDDPAEARQYPLRFDLSHNHLAVFGDSGMGKTSLLRSLVVSLTATHSPDEFHVYVLDLGGRNFRSLEDIPHLGAVIYADEEAYEERQQRLLDRLNRVVEERQQILSNADAANLYEYNECHPDQALPAVVVVIDNFAELQENYEALVDSTIVPLVRRSLSAGISFVISGNVPHNMPSKLYNLFGERITFQQTNSDRYLDIVGRGAIEIDDIPGRGYIRVGRRPLMFHSAQPVGIFDEESGRDTRSEADELRLMAAFMRKHMAGKTWRSTPEPIEILPAVVPLEAMLEQAGAIRPRRVQAVLGQNSSLQPALFDLKRMGPHFAVVGPPLSGKTTTLHNWVLSLADRYPPQQVRMVLIDIQRKFFEYGGRRKLDELPHVLAALSELEGLDDLIANLKNEGEALCAQDGDREIFVVIDNFDDFNEELESNRDWPRELAGLARRYGRDGLHFIIAGTLDGPVSELRRRVQSANYGIGLRTAQALETLRVVRTPPGLRGKELPAGRGYIVKSGQPTMIQVGLPYDGLEAGASPNGFDNEEEERAAQALDHWVQRIQAKYTGQRASWSPGAAQAQTSQAIASQQSKKLGRIFAVLQRGMRKEISQMEEGNGLGDLITAKLIRMDILSWNDEKALMALLKDLWEREQRARNVSDDLIKSYLSMDDESFLLEFEGFLLTEGKE
jgi:S-DNA-T family DNA segregation ATPase FtsK/SpoIIIE